MTQQKEVLAQALLANQHVIAEDIQEKLLAYIDLLQRWNRVYNLTAIRHFDEIISLHLLDSLSILPYLKGTRLIDVGTGAGFPGIPLALICPEKQFFLLDSNNKKTRFLTQVICELGIKNVEVIHSRCESFHPDECFDTIMTRAFASLQQIVLSTQHLLGPEGQFLAMKGIYPKDEIKELPASFCVLAVHELVIQGIHAKRHLVCIGKEF